MTTALYRRYRPETFRDVIGQEHVTEPLMQALRTGRVNHAYLFSGPRGCGKTTSARILARCLNCEQGPTPEPCGVCESCVALARGGPGTVDVIEIDAASHGGVDDARDLRERASYGPAQSRYKIYIIDEAHMVTPQGFNALLKIVEEPPEHVKFVFATTEPEKVIGTIRSRTHHYPFRLVPPARLTAYMEQLCEQEKVRVAPGVLGFVTRAGGGSVRDSLSVLDQLIAGSGDEGLTYEGAASLLGFTDGELLDATIDALAAGDGAAVFAQVDRVIESGHDPRRFVEDLLERLRDLIIVAAVPEGAGVRAARRARGPARADARPAVPLRPRRALARGRHRQRRAHRDDRRHRPADAARADLRADPPARGVRLDAGMPPASTGSNAASTSAAPPPRRGPTGRRPTGAAATRPRPRTRRRSTATRSAPEAPAPADGPRRIRSSGPPDPPSRSARPRPVPRDRVSRRPLGRWPEGDRRRHRSTRHRSQHGAPCQSSGVGSAPVRSTPRLYGGCGPTCWPGCSVCAGSPGPSCPSTPRCGLRRARLVLQIATVGLANTFRQGNHAELVRQALIDEIGVDVPVEGVPLTDAGRGRRWARAGSGASGASGVGGPPMVDWPEPGDASDRRHHEGGAVAPAAPDQAGPAAGTGPSASTAAAEPAGGVRGRVAAGHGTRADAPDPGGEPDEGRFPPTTSSRRPEDSGDPRRSTTASPPPAGVVLAVVRAARHRPEQGSTAAPRRRPSRRSQSRHDASRRRRQRRGRGHRHLRRRGSAGDRAGPRRAADLRVRGLTRPTPERGGFGPLEGVAIVRGP